MTNGEQLDLFPTKTPSRHRLIIAGSRDYIGGVQGIDDAVCRSGFNPEVVISGGARGVDAAADLWATRKGIPSFVEPANWALYSGHAGRIRNELMAIAYHATALLALWDGKSPGTKHMIDVARRLKLAVCIWWENEWSPNNGR